MKNRLIFLPFATLVALAAYLGWQMGQPLTETEVLDAQAARWVETGPSGAKATDCFGLPGGDENTWIIVTCVHENGETRRYYVARNGRVISLEESPQA